ncbi:MAG: tetratricopeptide repeat protein [Rhodoferax sp.]|nr:tetratricopeptide repeat protein [Rhodoferax sp.]
MRHNTRSTSPLLIALIGSIIALAGCDKMPNMSKPEQAPAPAPVAAPAPAVVAASASAPTPAPAATSPSTGPSLEVSSHIKQAFAYIGIAKNARDVAIREENIDNALKEFSLAIQKDPKYAEAYSNRAVAYMQQKKFNKAEDDLRQAKELAPDSPSVRYNYASLHSLKGNVDLALDEIDAALTKGFTDYDALRLDPDLVNVRKHPEFRKILEKHKVFIVK